MDRGAWSATGHGIAKSQKDLSDYTFIFSPLLRVYPIPPSLDLVSCPHFITLC